MTVHWLDPNARDRKMAILACEKTMGSHTHDVLTQVMENIHSQFGIEDKFTMTTTDNAGNSQKAFVQFVSGLDDHQEEEARVSEPEAEPADAHREELIADPLEQWFLTCGESPTGGEWRSCQVGNDWSDRRTSLFFFLIDVFLFLFVCFWCLLLVTDAVVGNGELAH
ncbi:uncharacterized protein LOC143039174 [Oratosquilla oratoria]|uniref:uncharacterized protein LOC143039174 n=1 Tax=Oratosquilla oratoria TaxID=337810 RepID=UPI003F768FD9